MAQQGWHPEFIKAAIRATGTTLTELSLQAGLSESAVRRAILTNTCPAGERVIIEYLQGRPQYLNLRPYDLWPQRYNKAGQRIIGHAAAQSTKNKMGRHGQKGVAA